MVDAITRRAPAPAQRRRRTEETHGGFRLAVVKIVRWAVRRMPPEYAHPFDELHAPELWQWNDPDAGYAAFGDVSATAHIHSFPEP